ncbi:hypothetical protein [Mucilaginibacter kameinonensis]|uniref:hypothetical protein n=1 Tax=Mucilaginibacter kameinonensis TaxID=452286 RepID=UPI000EF78D3E|nr:hypothetical protein [Mucilaginibacter kameinonensis]
MKLRYLAALLLFTIISCKMSRAANAAGITDTLGTKIQTINYQLKASGEDTATLEDGLMPWISLDHPEKQIDSLIGANEVVLPYKKVTLIIDYPLTRQAVLEISSQTENFTRKDLILAISKKYHEIYEEETKTAQTKVVPPDQRNGVINRNETEGKYGICCHDLTDLDLGSVEVYKGINDKIYLILEVES